MEVLQSNFHFIQFDKVTDYLSENELFDPALSHFYQQAFIEMEKVGNELKVLKGLTQMEYFKTAEQLVNYKNQNFMIKEETVCSKC